MKLEAHIDEETGVARVVMEISTIEDASRADDFFHNVARALLPDVVFTGEPGFDDAEPQGAEAAKGEDRAHRPDQTPRNFTALPRAGSPSAFVLEAARRLRTIDAVKIADELDMRTNNVGSMLRALRLGGHLESLSCN